MRWIDRVALTHLWRKVMPQNVSAMLPVQSVNGVPVRAQRDAPTFPGKNSVELRSIGNVGELAV
jgi:hypothetical protein